MALKISDILNPTFGGVDENGNGLGILVKTINVKDTEKNKTQAQINKEVSDSLTSINSTLSAGIGAPVFDGVVTAVTYTYEPLQSGETIKKINYVSQIYAFAAEAGDNGVFYVNFDGSDAYQTGSTADDVEIIKSKFYFNKSNDSMYAWDNTNNILSAVADESIETSEIANLAVTTEKLANDAVTAEKIKNNAVTTDKILNKNVTSDKLSDEIKNQLASISVNANNISGLQVEIDNLKQSQGTAASVNAIYGDEADHTSEIAAGTFTPNVTLTGLQDLVDGLMNKNYPFDVSMSANPNSVEYNGNAHTVTLSWSSNSAFPGFDAGAVKYTLKSGGTVIEDISNTTSSGVQTDISAATTTNGFSTTTFSLTGVDPLTGRTDTATASVTQVARQFMFTTEGTVAQDAFTAALDAFEEIFEDTGLEATTNLNTKYTTSTAIDYNHNTDGGYLWLFVPSKYTLNSILIDNNALQAVTIIDTVATATRIIGSTNVTYNAYRSVNALNKGTYNLRVNLK